MKLGEMQSGSQIVIADTSCFILLSRIGELHILRLLYTTVVTTPAIAMEFGNVLPSWVFVREAVESAPVKFAVNLGKGEISAICLAMEYPGGSILVLDDMKARKEAEVLQLLVTGTLGVILAARKEGYIANLRPVLEKIRAMNFRLTEDLIQRMLNAAGEL